MNDDEQTVARNYQFLSLKPMVVAFNVTESVRLEPVFEVFNLTNNKNIRRPEVTSLIFNFDGTVQSGLGEPRQAQLGPRVRF